MSYPSMCGKLHYLPYLGTQASHVNVLVALGLRRPKCNYKYTRLCDSKPNLFMVHIQGLKSYITSLHFYKAKKKRKRSLKKNYSPQKKNFLKSFLLLHSSRLLTNTNNVFLTITRFVDLKSCAYFYSKSLIMVALNFLFKRTSIIVLEKKRVMAHHLYSL